jgi:hypothetical protein
MRTTLARFSVLIGLVSVACVESQPRRTNPPPNYGTYNPNYGQPPPNYSNSPTAAPGTYGNPPYASQPGPVTQPVPAQNATGLNPPPFSGYDPIASGALQFLNNRSTQVVAELIANLDSTTQGRVRNIPIVYDTNASEVNAYASCTQSGKSAVTVTNGLQLVAAHLAEAQAVDDVFGTRHVDDYIQYIAKYQKQGQPVLAPPANYYTQAQLADPRMQSREQQVFDEEVGFVLGHELAHHYLNHLPCTSILPLDASEIGQVVTSAVPMFNQPNESAADVAGVTNVLRTGAQRAGYHFTEGGALLTMRFFAGLDQSSPVDIFTFERTHPPPSIRTPIIQTAAQVFRTTSGIHLPWGN